MNKICPYCNTKNIFPKNTVKLQNDGYGIYCRFCRTFIKIENKFPKKLKGTLKPFVNDYQEILNVLLDGETNLDLKTSVIRPQQLSEKNITNKLINDTLKLQVSNNRLSRTEFIDMITTKSIIQDLIKPTNKNISISSVFLIMIMVLTIPLIIIILTKIFK